MTLRHKFGSLAFIYVISLTANVVLCAWCILEYYSSLFEGFAAVQASSGLHLNDVGPAVVETNADALATWPAESPEATANPMAEGADRKSPIARGVEARIVSLLVFNTACGLGLALLGLRLVHRWVSQPIADLRQATAQIAHGNLAHRITVRAEDELGHLARDVNEMALLVTRMQRKLVEQEKRAVAGQTVRCVVHNIRSPLTGIRWLAEAIAMRRSLDPSTTRKQETIVERVDGLLDWLLRFRESLAKATLDIEPVPTGELLDEVIAILRSSLDTAGVEITYLIESTLETVQLDRDQFAPALAAMLGEVLADCQRGELIEINVRRTGQLTAQWELDTQRASAPTALPPTRTAADATAGDPNEAEALETAGPRSMADRVVRMHGGQLDVFSEASGVRGFRLTMPE